MRAPKILVVEDDVDSYDLYSDYLASAGYSVAGADNGLDAIEAARRWRPDLILMDVVLPGASGFEAARLLKSDERTRGIPIVALTGLVQDRYVEQARAAGCDTLLHKPCSLSLLRAEIERLIFGGDDDQPASSTP